MTDPTNGQVAVSAEFSADTMKKEYSLDGIEYFEYNGSVIFDDNGSVWFRGIDAAGNVSDVIKHEVTNIDKVAPVAPVASADVTDPTNGQVVVSAEFSADTVKKEYSLDGVNFTEYSAGIEFAANGSVWFRGTDAAGNVSDVIKHEVTNIDKVAPAVPAVSVSVTESTNGQVVISAEFSADTVKKEYSLDGVEYSEYTGAVIFDDNGSVWFRGTDAAGNVSDVIKHEVTNIDKVAPVLTISGNAEGWTNGNVVLKAAASEADCVIEYQKDGEWAAYTDDGVTLEENGLVSFKVTDKAGNVTYQSEEVKFIDKVAPVLTTSYDSAWTEDPVTVYAAVKEEGVTITYQINGQGEWLAYADGVTIESNCVVNFKAVDKAGNATVENVKIDNIWGGDDVDDDVESDWTPAVVDKVDIKTTETHTDYAETELQFASGNTSIKVASGTKASKTGAYSVTTFEAGAITKAENAAGVNNINIGNYAELKINGEIEALGKLTIGKESAANVAGKVTGTAGNQTIQIGKASKAVFADIDLLGGKNTIKIGAGSDFAAQDIDNVSKLNVSNGKQGVMGSFAATAINGTAKNDTVSFGNWNNGFVDYKIDLGDGNDTLKIGNNSIVDLGKVDFGSGKDTLKIGKNSSVSVSELKKLEVFNAGKGTEIIFNNGAADIEFDSAMTGSWTNATLLDEAGELQMGENAVNVYSNEYDVFNFMAYKDGQLTLNSENDDVIFEYQLDSSDKWLVYDGGLNLSAGDELSVRVAVDFVDKKDKFAKVAAAFDATLA